MTRRPDLREIFCGSNPIHGDRTAAVGTAFPLPRAHVERVIGTIRRECLDHVIVFGERSLYRHLRRFVDYYRQSRTRLGFKKRHTGVAPDSIGGLHHPFERLAA